MIADMKWEASIVLLSILLVTTSSTKVNMTQEWIPDLGWEITCTWTFTDGDRLQSVSMQKNNQSFMMYRPRNMHGSPMTHSWSFPEYRMDLNCKEDIAKCVIKVEPIQPPTKNQNFSCDVSGEGPEFYTDAKSIVVEAIVAPTDAELVITRLTDDSNPVLNCSSSGIPAPNIVWTVGEHEIKVPGHFHGSQSWNATSKMWYVWSTFIPTSDHALPVVCTPKVARGGRQIDGKSALYNSALYSGVRGILDAVKLLAVVMGAVLLR